MVGPLEGLIYWVCKIWLQKICKIFAFELGSNSGIMRGLQNGITLGGSTSGRVNLLGVQKRVAKKCAKFLHLSWDSSWES